MGGWKRNARRLKRKLKLRKRGTRMRRGFRKKNQRKIRLTGTRWREKRRRGKKEKKGRRGNGRKLTEKLSRRLPRSGRKRKELLTRERWITQIRGGERRTQRRE